MANTLLLIICLAAIIYKEWMTITWMLKTTPFWLEGLIIPGMGMQQSALTTAPAGGTCTPLAVGCWYVTWYIVLKHPSRDSWNPEQNCKNRFLVNQGSAFPLWDNTGIESITYFGHACSFRFCSKSTANDYHEPSSTSIRHYQPWLSIVTPSFADIGSLPHSSSLLLWVQLIQSLKVRSGHTCMSTQAPMIIH